LGGPPEEDVKEAGRETAAGAGNPPAAEAEGDMQKALDLRQHKGEGEKRGGQSPETAWMPVEPEIDQRMGRGGERESGGTVSAGSKGAADENPVRGSGVGRRKTSSEPRAERHGGRQREGTSN